MSTTNAGLSNLQAAVGKLQTDFAKLQADVTTLLSNQQPGLQPGQVIVAQADIDQLAASIGSIDTGVAQTDATVVPPTPGV